MKLEFLPMFFEDLDRCVVYIADVLENPIAANKLIDDIEKAIETRLPRADKYPIYQSSKKRKTPYRYIRVKGYVIYYVVLETDNGKVMEVRRLLHSLQNRDIIL